jgi:hypothetical protein
MTRTNPKSPKAKKPEIKRPKGRPSDYSAQIAEIICSRIGDGESLRHICTSPGIPGKSSIMRWLEANPEFRDQYARARELQAEHWAEEIIEIADDSRNDFIEKEGRDGSTYEAVDGEHINRSRLRVDTRKWLMARLAPKKYGDRVTNELIGDKDNPLVSHHVVQVEFVAAKGARPATEGNA